VRVVAVGKAFPPHYYDQEALLGALETVWSRHHYNLDRLRLLHRNVLVGGRHLALPLGEYETLDTWGKANSAWIRIAQEVGEQAVRDALGRAHLSVEDVDALLFATVTGISTPSIDALLMNRLRLSPRVRRTPIFGLGCVAGAAGISQAADYVKAYPDRIAVLLSVELCSLTFQRGDVSIPNLIASGLFGDGAAAVVVAGSARTAEGPRIVATRSVFYPDSEDVMGWSVEDGGFRVVLSADVPLVVLRYLARDVDCFLGEHGLERRDISTWISHPGGPKVLLAVQQALGLTDEALESSWRSLREIGNLSSASVLMVLHDVINSRALSRGSYGLLMAMGPGFCAELVLLQW
jgi:alkylresorcinol/alkylpyrone synthase